MSLGMESMSPADIAAVTGNNNNGGNDVFGGNSGWWLILLLLVLFGAGGWGGLGNGGMGGGAGGNMLYPWMNQSEQINDGFRDQMLNNNVTSIRDGINGLSTQLCNCCSDISGQLCNGFSGTNATITNAQNALATQMYGNTIADLERSFASQTATMQGMNSIQSQLAQCCCDNRAGLADVKYTIASENCADRAAISDGIRDLLTAQTASTQRILDQLCNDKIDAKNERIADLERQLTMANLAASQTAQTAQIRAGQVAEIDAMYNRLRDCPVPTMPVYGSQPIFTCPNNNSGCGCGCGGNF